MPTVCPTAPTSQLKSLSILRLKSSMMFCAGLSKDKHCRGICRDTNKFPRPARHVLVESKAQEAFLGLKMCNFIFEGHLVDCAM